MTHPDKTPGPLPKRPPGPRTLDDDIASIPPGGAPEAVREEERRKAEERGGILPDDTESGDTD